jgi:glycosyltransferase involved in cell wall biosynthesis
LKILHINTRDYGGAAIAAIRLHKALLDEGVDSSMLFLEQSDPDIPAAFSFRKEENNRSGYLIRKIVSAKNKLLKGISQSQRNNAKLENRVKGLEMFSFNPSDYDVSLHPAYREADVIHLHWSARFFDFRSFQRMRKPVIWTLHDMNPFTGGCHFSKGCSNYETACKNCPQLAGTKDINNAWINQEYKRKNLEGMSPVITAPSNWMKSCSAKSLLFRNFKSLSIPNSVDLQVFKQLNKLFCREALNWPAEKKIMLFVSEEIDNYRKGFDLLIKAQSEITAFQILTFVIGTTGMSEISIPGIRYQGRINDERLMALAYSAADAVVIPSREDNLPNVMLESLACGTPVISFPVGGMPDVITNSFNGLLAEEVTAESLAKTIAEFFENPGIFKRNEISAHAGIYFSPQIQASAYIRLYKEMLN